MTTHPAGTLPAASAGADAASPARSWIDDFWFARPLRRVAAIPLGTFGMLASIIMTLASFGGGATRSHGGVLVALRLAFFQYGHGAAIANVSLLIGTILFVLAWVRLGQRVIRGGIGDDAASMSALNRICLKWVGPLLFAGPFMSRDIYSYLMQGALLGKGFDPYTQGAAFNPGPYLVEVSPDWRNTTTPYGPLHLWIGKIITSIVGDNITAGLFLYKLVSLAGFAVLVYAVPRIASHLGASPSFALWIGVLNPLMVFHLVGGMHNEAVMVSLTCLGILLALRGRILGGIAVIAVAMSLKATAAFVLPFVVWYAVARREGTKNKALAFLGYGAAGAVITVAILWAITWASGSNFGWIAALTGNTKVINPLAFPSFVTSSIGLVASVWTDTFPYNSLLGVVREASMVIMGLGMIGCWWYFRKSELAATRGMIGAYIFAFVFNSVTLPWYYASIISLIGTVRPRPWMQKLATGFSIIVAMAFTGGGNHQLYNIVWMTIAILGAWWAVQWIFHGSVDKQKQGEAETATGVE